MIHEWPEGRSNPARNQEASHLRSRAALRSARTGLSMHIGNKLAVKESVLRCTQKEGCRRGFGPS